ncbi:hypothetical protein HS088_TW14G00427 [Tripterygium wilfordii]|uniref:Bromo domain-containing protein n=1 Tax=Tripterygium wilfordii TaxID=458696 RepID=A0A7J7CQK5_TRIWF|nr:transcription factor GTE12-like [Tripterygium wilfordii]KAF5736288.1 hypothetical protein HS088_TW14G00427 [Tripterygium wilfordii]
MIAAETVLAKGRLRIKFPSKKLETVSGTRSCDYGQNLSLIDVGDHCSKYGSNHSEMIKSHSAVICSSVKKNFGGDLPEQKSNIMAAKKRGLPGEAECQREKKQKIDRAVTQQCAAILKALMRHPAGWVFNQAVDPVKLKIPDYFSIISKPMDLGTVKSKLDKNMYFSTEEFAADVRLTFSNAMLYNPRWNDVHKMAEELKNIFELKWKSVEDERNCERLKFGQGNVLSGHAKEFYEARQNCPRTSHLSTSLSTGTPKSAEGKTIGTCDAKSAKVKLAKVGQNCERKPVAENFCEGNDTVSRRARGFANTKPSMSHVVCKCRTIGRNMCRCSLAVDSVHASSVDNSSEISIGGDHHPSIADISKLDWQAKKTSTSHTSKSDGTSDGAVSSIEDESLCLSSQLTISATDATSVEGWGTSIYDVELSPKRALRAAMLKSRFADTIVKAQQKTLLDQGDKADPVKLRVEKEKLEKKQREEKARIEAQIRATEAAAREREEAELKKHREKAREASRIALLQMKRTVEIEQNVLIERELEMLCGCSLLYHLDTEGSGVEGKFVFRHIGNPLERLGLFMKDYMTEEEEIFNPGEEGEIFPVKC